MYSLRLRRDMRVSQSRVVRCIRSWVSVWYAVQRAGRATRYRPWDGAVLQAEAAYGTRGGKEGGEMICDGVDNEVWPW